MDIAKEIEKLSHSPVGERVNTVRLENDKKIIVKVTSIEHNCTAMGICPCTSCAFGSWKAIKKQIEHPYIIGGTVDVNRYEYSCPLFPACNSKDREDRRSVVFTVM